MNSAFRFIASYFVGESSKKRQIGIGFGLILSSLFFTGVIDQALYEALMPFVVLWTGAAFSARLTKLQKAIINAKSD